MRPFLNFVAHLPYKQERWPWSARHTWQSWMTRYITHLDSFDLRIRAYLKDRQPTNSPPPPPPTPTPRAAFMPEEDQRLMTSLAQSSPGASGAADIYPDILVANVSSSLQSVIAQIESVSHIIARAR